MLRIAARVWAGDAGMSAASDEGDKFDDIAVLKFAGGVFALGDEFAIDFGSAGTAGETETLDELGEGERRGFLVRLAVDGEGHAGW